MTGAATVETGPMVGDMLPDFTVRTTEGRTIHRRDFKGRRHLVLCFAHPQARDDGRGLLTELGKIYDGCRAERAEVLLVLPSDVAVDEMTYPCPVVVDERGALRARFGATAGAAIFIADRYGEVMVRHDSTEVDDAPPTPYGLPLGTVLTALGWLETRCSL